MIKLNLTPDELPIVATIIESAGAGLFVSKVKRYLKDVINVTVLQNNFFTIELDIWVAIWLLSNMYSAEVAGASASFMYKLEDALETTEVTDPNVISMVAE
jgi:hypothetical protein